MGTNLERYRAAELEFWDHYGLAPTERFVELEGGPRLRVQEVGDGTAVLFVHGTGGPGAYFAPLIRELEGFRCIALDRPGWGLSSPVDYAGRSYATVAVELLTAVLDELAVDRVHLVGGSIGNLWALRMAQADPERVGKVVLLGAGPLTREIRVPTFIRLLRSPLGRIIISIPEKPGMFRKQLAGLGHKSSLDAGRIPQAFVDWHVGMSRDTEWGRHERDMVRAIVRPGGFVPGLVLDPAEIATLLHPTLMVYGSEDRIGSVEVWERFTAAMPHGELEVVEGGGHLVWYDDPQAVGARVRSFLQG